MGVIVVGLLWMTWILQIQGEITWIEGSLQRQELQCDGFPIELDCPGSDVIKIQTSHYGRRDERHCPTYRAKNYTSCDLPNAKEIVAKRCNNRTQCNFDVSRSIFPDPCPGVGKYLEVTYKCVKFLFKCPGHLSGIGAQVKYTVNALPQVGSWTTDPLDLMYPERVYFATSGRFLHMYTDMDNFINGSPMKNYELPSKLSSRNIVVYDGNMYYVKAKSRNIVRYNLITLKRTKEYKIPPGHRKDDNAKISLHVDEAGLWATYDNEDERIVISKLAKDTLTPQNTWVTNLKQDQTLYNFIICGTLYSVSAASGLVDYSYDTNAQRNREKNGPPIQFEVASKFPFSGKRGQIETSFRSYNASSLTYNPREKRLYLWDAANAKAIKFQLRFHMAEHAGTTRTPQYSSRRQEAIATTHKQPRKKGTLNVCPSIEHNGMEWPAVSAGQIAKQQCFDGTKGQATWRCVKLSTEKLAEWDNEGPSMPDCVDWINGIAASYHRDKASLEFTAESLQLATAQRQREISGKELRVLINFLKDSLQNAFPTNKPSAARIVRAVTKILSTLVESKNAWFGLDATTRTKLVNDIMVSIEEATALYVNGLSSKSINTIESIQASDKNIFLQVQLREKPRWDGTYSGKTVFPDDNFCKTNYLQHCTSDVIVVPQWTVEGSGGKLGMLSVIYRGLDNIILQGSNSGEILDSSVTSVTVTNKVMTSLSSRAPPSVDVTLRHTSSSSGMRRCAKYVYSELSDTVNWAVDGCRTADSNSTHTKCECEGLGKYALILIPSSNEPISTEPRLKIYEESLEIITSAGSAVAIICFLASFVNFLVLRNLKGDQYSIRKNISACALAAELIFLVGISRTSDHNACAVIAGFLQYSLLATFTWIILDAVQLYRMLMDMFEEESRWRIYYAAGYGVPAIVVAVSVGVGYQEYGTTSACFIEPTSGVMLLPIISTLAAIVATIGVLCASIYKICTASLTFASCGLISEIRSSIKMSFMILFLQLMTWTVAVSWINERSTLLAILFCTFNSTLGIGTVICYCILPKQVRKECKTLLKRMGCSSSKETTTFEKSATFQRSYTPARYTTSNSNGVITIGSLGKRQYGPWNVTIPKTLASSPEDLTRTFETRDRSIISHRSPPFELQHMYTLDPTREYDLGQQTTLLPTYRDEPERKNNEAAQNETHRENFHRHGRSECLHQSSRCDLDSGIRHQKYRTGLPAAPRRHLQQRSCTMGQEYSTNTNPYLVPKSRSRPSLRSSDLLRHKRRSIDKPLMSLRNLDHNLHSRDPRFTQNDIDYEQPMDINALPPNSIIQRLRDEMLPRHDSVHFKPVTAGSNPPKQMQLNNFTSSLNSRRKSHIRNESNISEDEGQGSSVEGTEHTANLYTHSDANPSRRAIYEEIPFPPHQTSFQMQHAVTSDLDDPIVTDYSGDGNESPIARHIRQWSNQEMLV